jgi:hypothetical protein
LVRHRGGLTGVYADELELLDRCLFELAVGLDDLAAASAAANIGG